MHAYLTPNNVLPFRPVTDAPFPEGSAAGTSTHQHVQFFSSGSEIYGQGETAGPVYQVEFGAVRVHRLLPDGRRQISAFHLPGEAFGFESDSVHHFFAEAIVATGLRAFRQTSGREMAGDLLPLALLSLTKAQEHLLVLGRQHAIERVAVFLADMAERQGGTGHIDLPMPRADIGDYLGLTIETVSRILTKLKAKGIIRLTGMRSIEVCKRGALLGVSECQFAA
jgi:CRP/FNR family transcriptional regulator, nitrogen fixation regulation protein